METKEVELHFVINIILFVLYILCFASLYYPNLEIVGFALFFVLHTIMSFIMINRLAAIRIAPAVLLTTKWFTIPVSWTIFIGLILLFVSLLLLIITFVNVHAIYTRTGTPSKDGLNLFFPNNQLDLVDKKRQFKIIAITTTVLLWAQYLLYANYTFFKLLFIEIANNINKLYNIIIPNKQNIPVVADSKPAIQLLFYLFSAGILSLSSTSVWLTQQIGSKTGSIVDPPQ